MTKGAKCGVAWHVQVTVWCVLAIAMTTLTQRSDAARATSWSNIGSEAGNFDEEASSSPNVTADVKSSTEIFFGNTEQENFEPDELLTRLLEAADKLKIELVVENSHIKVNQSSNKKLATDSKSESGSEFMGREQNAIMAERQSNGSQKIIIAEKDIVIILRNQIPHDTIRVKCQSLKDSTVVNDFDLISIAPDSGYIWKATEVDDRPNLVKCVIYWDRHDIYMTYNLYQDNYTAQSLWRVDAAGLFRYLVNLGYVMVQSWEKELQVENILH